MAMLTVQPMAAGGTRAAYARADAGGDAAPTGRGLLLHVRNNGKEPVTVTVPAHVRRTDRAARKRASVDCKLPGGDAVFVPLTPVYRSPVTGRALVTYSDTTAVDVAVLQMP